MTTFGLPAGCGRFVQYDNIADLQQLYADGALTDALHIGGGSNLLFTTGHYAGTVLHRRDRSFTISAPDSNGDVLLTASAGCVMDHLCQITAEAGLWGLENLSGIPGEAGGAAVQNVGAYGTEFKDVAESVAVFDTATGTQRTIPASECAYGYRDSMFKHSTNTGRLIVTEVTLRLHTNPTPRLGYAALQKQFGDIPAEQLTPTLLRDAVKALRDGKLPDPATTGSAGSFFKNPVVSADLYAEMQKKLNQDIPSHVTPTGEVKLVAAWLIDKAGCKPMRCGGAALWPSQPLVIVNATGHASGHDVVELEENVRRAVADKFGVQLVPEVIHI